MGFLHGKRALIVGPANQRSITWGLALAMHREGAQLAFTYASERLKDCTEEAANAFGANLVFPCDVAEDAQIETLAKLLDAHWKGLDILVHAVWPAPKEALPGRYLEVLSRESFRIAHEICSYSLIALAKAFRPQMREHGGAILTLSGLGANEAMDHGNVIGLAKTSLEASVRYLALDLGAEGTRVNAISAGGINAPATSGIANASPLLGQAETPAPSRRRVTINEVGNVGAFLCSDLASGVTGEIIHVDAGYHLMGAAL